MSEPAFLTDTRASWPGRRTEVFGRAVSLDYHRRPVEEVAALMAAAGLDVRVRVVREPEPWRGYESTPQAYLLGRRAPAGG